MRTVRNLHVVADIAIVFVLAVHILGLVGLGGTGEATAQPPTPAKPGSGAYGEGWNGRLCFPKASWDAAERYRPCISIIRVSEDGSFTFAAEDYNGVVRYVEGVGVPDRYENASR